VSWRAAAAPESAASQLPQVTLIFHRFDEQEHDPQARAPDIQVTPPQPSSSSLPPPPLCLLILFASSSSSPMQMTASLSGEQRACGGNFSPLSPLPLSPFPSPLSAAIGNFWDVLGSESYCLVSNEIKYPQVKPIIQTTSNQKKLKNGLLMQV